MKSLVLGEHVIYTGQVLVSNIDINYEESDIPKDTELKVQKISEDDDKIRIYLHSNKHRRDFILSKQEIKDSISQNDMLLQTPFGDRN